MVFLVPFWCLFGKDCPFNVRATEIMSGIPKRPFLNKVRGDRG